VPIPFPFSAIVGQEEMKRAILIAAVDPSVGGVLVFGDRGTGKSTAVRALAALLPKMRVVPGCRYNCDPQADNRLCPDVCEQRRGKTPDKGRLVPVPVVDLPLGSTEDRVVGGRPSPAHRISPLTANLCTMARAASSPPRCSCRAMCAIR